MIRAALLLCLALAACAKQPSRENELDRIDSELADRGNAGAPVLPTVVPQAPQPAARPTRGVGEKTCRDRLVTAAAWATKLPAAVPLYPEARVDEAAGTDAAGCAMRVVSFTAPAPLDRVLGWYADHARRAGFSAERQPHGSGAVLGGTRGEAAYLLFAEPRRGGGSSIDLMVNGG